MKKKLHILNNITAAVMAAVIYVDVNLQSDSLRKADHIVDFAVS